MMLFRLLYLSHEKRCSGVQYWLECSKLRAFISDSTLKTAKLIEFLANKKENPVIMCHRERTGSKSAD